MVPPNNLGPDLAGKPVNETSYRGMIRSLMYLTATRRDIKFSIVLCARYQSNRKELHLTTVKRILRYLKEKAPQVPAKFLVENWFIRVLRNSSQWLCPQLRLNMLLLLGVVQILSGNYSSTKQVNSIQQLLAYCLITRTEGPKAFGALFKKRKQPKPKKTPSKTKVISPKPMEGSEQSYLVSSGTVPDPQYLERNIQLSSMGLPSTLDEGTRKSQPLPKGTTTDPKDSRGND
ncbi:hypothetical protein Tco_0617788 [Tanacetum coccineum]